MIKIFSAESKPRFFIAAGLALLVAILTLAYSPAAIYASPQAVVRPDPLSVGMKSGEAGKISIRVENAESMYGIEFHLSFDPNVVQVVDADSAKPGVQLTPGDWLKGGFVAVNKVDNAKGTIDYAVTLLNPAPPVSGSGIIATISLKAKSNGTSPLKFTKAILATREAKEIQAQLQDGAIGVSVLGQAPAVQQTTGGSGQPPSGGSAPAATTGPSIPQLLLVGAAGLGVLGFLGAVVLVGAILLWRQRR